MIGHRTYRFTRWTTGLSNSQNLKNIYSISFGYTDYHKKVAAGAVAAIHAAVNSALTSQTIDTSITQPDVPRALAITPGGTTSDIRTGSTIVVTGTNVEGKTITDTFVLTKSSSAQIVGVKAFKTVTSYAIGAQDGTGATFSLDTSNKLGVFHRLYPLNTTVKVIQATSISAVPLIQGVPTVVSNEADVEKNLVTPATTPDGTTMLVIAYSYDNWNVAALNDDPAYSTSTSTSSTSSSTSTSSTSSSTSSTSSSTSSTSSSTSSTSTSSTSTSTSTTTLP